MTHCFALSDPRQPCRHHLLLLYASLLHPTAYSILKGPYPNVTCPVVIWCHWLDTWLTLYIGLCFVVWWLSEFPSVACSLLPCCTNQPFIQLSKYRSLSRSVTFFPGEVYQSLRCSTWCLAATGDSVFLHLQLSHRKYWNREQGSLHTHSPQVSERVNSM